MVQSKYVFDKAVDKHIEKFLGKKWLKKNNYHRAAATVSLGHSCKVEFTIQQKTGKINVEYAKKENDLSDHVPELLRILKSCVRVSRRSATRRRQRGGQVVYTPLEGRRIGEPDAIPTVASEKDYKKDGFTEYPDLGASANE